MSSEDPQIRRLAGEIAHFKRLMVNELTKLNANSDVFFSFGQWITEIVDRAYDIGVIGIKLDHDLDD